MGGQTCEAAARSMDWCLPVKRAWSLKRGAWRLQLGLIALMREPCAVPPEERTVSAAELGSMARCQLAMRQLCVKFTFSEAPWYETVRDVHTSATPNLQLVQ